MFVPQILRFESLPSTNLEAARLAAEGADEGLCVLAREQTAGRGRLQRQWISPKDAGLYFSIVLRPRFEQSAWSLLTLMAAVAVHDVLLDACGVEADIKWPNDLLVNEKKICGILAETVETPAGRAVVVGIGINLTRHSLPENLPVEATSVETVNGRTDQFEILPAALIAALGKYYVMLNEPEGREKILQAWRMRSSYPEGKVVRVIESGQSFVGTTRGLEGDGALRVETSDGKIRVVRAGDVTNLRPELES
ncbi:MAG TPA: biotin--[acetyl-CoA-carboxylase] ligase [Pyrinomonadaceae bacterium]|jgi:BirA family biotin operon repressor/biotin-[acetyl-CoA-carboxylase] ligase